MNWGSCHFKWGFSIVTYNSTEEWGSKMKIFLMRMLNWPIEWTENGENWTDWLGAALKISTTLSDVQIFCSKKKTVWEVNCQHLYGHIFYCFGDYILDFYECFNQNLSEHNVKSLMEGYVGADQTHFSSLISIQLNFSCDHWELIWDHVFGKLFDFKPALINCA